MDFHHEHDSPLVLLTVLQNDVGYCFIVFCSISISLFLSSVKANSLNTEV